MPTNLWHFVSFCSRRLTAISASRKELGLPRAPRSACGIDPPTSLPVGRSSSGRLTANSMGDPPVPRSRSCRKNGYEQFALRISNRRRELQLGIAQDQKDMARASRAIAKLRLEYDSHAAAMRKVGESMQSLDNEELKWLKERSAQVRSLAEARKRKTIHMPSGFSGLVQPRDNTCRNGGNDEAQVITLTLPHLNSWLTDGFSCTSHDHTESRRQSHRSTATGFDADTESNCSAWGLVDYFRGCGALADAFDYVKSASICRT